MIKPKLSVVIHAEEEFDWHNGFYRSNTQVSHGDELIAIMNKIISLGAKITLAMDYPFVKSQDGKKVIDTFKAKKDFVEFASHLHPWVNPPFEGSHDKVTNKHSFPGNLTKEVELAKLKRLTDLIEAQTGNKPITYLAGRYGIGKNTSEILNQLGYLVDLSVSSYSNFSHIEGPNFTEFTNKIRNKNGLVYLPHTCSNMACHRFLEDYINKNPSCLIKSQQSKIYALILKLCRIKKYRLSPEGFSFENMKALTKSQLRIGQDLFILSFHSPSVKLNGTPYVNSRDDLSKFEKSLMSYLRWFNSLTESSHFLPQSLVKQKRSSDLKNVNKAEFQI